MDRNIIECPNCGSIIEPNQRFCPYCGSKVSPDSKQSKWVEMKEWDCKDDEPEETTRIDDSDDRRPHYQTYAVPTENEHKKKKSHKGCLIAALVLLLVFSLIVAVVGNGFNKYLNENGYFETESTDNTDNTVRSKTESASYSSAEFCYKTIMDAVLLEEVGIDIAQYWHDTLFNNAYNSVDDAFAAVFEEHSEDVATINDDYHEITKLYQKALNLSEKEGNSALSEAIKDMYNNYVDLYNAVFYFNCSYSEFVDNFNAADTSLVSSLQTMAALLEDDLGLSNLG